MPATPFDETVWLPTSDSWSPKFRYASRNIPRSPMPSRKSPFGSGIQARVDGQSSVYAAGVRFPPSVNVELAGLAKFGWKRQTRQIEFSPDIRSGSGAPAGGGVEPSRSAGSIASLEPVKTLLPVYAT